ncbi:receptor for activated protein kinase C [Culex quinquefasciatus]|uniref:Receptor for activated protein kinase C n=1 Tax=Culex quinquefasciatus TaxID=7176 RepID=B0XH92_CULQU|nr:receptor for activated protein kinase C [Culex quinquefasciatus]|eukprot:XP_001869014.1 receptor for activated protein kinase C [Culex quinquefasciatus]
MTEILTEMQPCGQLVGHSGCLTQIATDSKYTDIVLSFSNDMTQILWKLTRDDANYDIPQKRLTLEGNNALRVAPARTELYRSRSVLTSGWRGDNPRLHTGLDLVIRSAPSPVRSVACRAGHCRISGLRLTDAPLTEVETHSRRTLDRVLSQRGRASRRTLAHVL